MSILDTKDNGLSAPRLDAVLERKCGQMGASTKDGSETTKRMVTVDLSSLTVITTRACGVMINSMVKVSRPI